MINDNIEHKRLEISCELNISNSTKIYNLLKESLKSDEKLLITLQNTNSVDISFVQILHSFLQKCESEKKIVAFEIQEPKEFSFRLLQMGYYNIFKTLSIINR